MILGPFAVTVGLLWLWARFFRGRRRNPLTRDLLRSPGESLRDQIDNVSWDLAGLFVFSAFPFAILYATYISQIAFEGTAPNPVVLIVVALGFQGWILYKIWVLLKTRRQLTLGYEAELAVGQELNQLARHQYHVFHDIPAKNFNVDHVLVGSNGVFAIETKGRSKPARNSNTSTWEVTYDGMSLGFPGWTETKPLQQATNQAKWLSEWLSSAVGEPVHVQPVLAIPGWYLKRTSKSGIPVLSGRNPDNYFLKAGGGRPLDDKLIQRIVHQLDQRCRDVAPRAYAPLKDNN